jgi:hypothetical protein
MYIQKAKTEKYNKLRITLDLQSAKKGFTKKKVANPVTT